METRNLIFVIYDIGAGGAERVLLNLANFLSYSNNVTILTFSNSNDFYKVNKRITRKKLGIHGKSGLFDILEVYKRTMQLRKAILSCNPDLVVSFMTPINNIVLASLIGKRVDVIISERNNPTKSVLGIKDKIFRRLLFRRASQIVVQTEKVKKWYQSNLKISPDKLITIPNPVSENYLHETDFKINNKKKKYSIILIGRLHPQKGYDLLFKAIANSKFCREKCEFNIYGEGMLRASLEEFIRDENLSETVFLKGRTKNVKRKLSESDLFLLPSRYEGFPNVLLEAMAVGVPSISFDANYGPRDIITNYHNGILIQNENGQEMIRKVEEVLCNISLRTKLSENARQSILKNYTPNAIFSRWENVIENTIVMRENKLLNERR